MAWKCTKEEGRTDGKKRQTLINMAFRHCYAVQPSLLLLFKSFIFQQDLLTLVCLFFSRWLNDNLLQHFPHPALSQETFSSLLFL